MEYTTAIAITTALVQVGKSYVPSKYTPLLSLLIGAGIGYVSGVTDVLALITIGLASSGLYDVVKEPTKTVISKMK